MDLNERFTDIADKVSQKIGEWPITAICLGCLIVWIILGPLQGFSNTWQLEANTPTTWIELFIGFLCAAATNRAEKHLHKLLGTISTMEKQMIRMERSHGNQLQTLQEVVAEQHALITELHSHVTCDGHTTIGDPTPPKPSAPAAAPAAKPRSHHKKPVPQQEAAA